MLVLPPLPEPYAAALASCAEAMLGQFDVLAIIASGTIVRGSPDPRSDLDVHIVHRGAFRQRLQQFHCGVPCEIFVNPPDRFAKYFEEERGDRRPSTAHMLATGTIVFDPEGVGEGLQTRARKLMADPPPASSADHLTRVHYGAATLIEDAMDLMPRNPEGAALLLGQAVRELVECRFLAEPGWLPRPKDLLAKLRELDPEAATLVAKASGAGTPESRLEAARHLSIRVTGSEGFFEWASPCEPA